MEIKSRVNKSTWLTLSGGLVLLISQILMLRNVEPFGYWFYPFVWWSYILIIDSIVHRLKGASLILSRFREFLVLSAWSVCIWLFFELINLFMKNWYYINVTDLQWARWAGYTISYATVLPALFETTELIECLGLFSRVKVKKIVVTDRLMTFSFAVGVIFLLAPIIFPSYGFPLIWGSLIFFLEPINYKKGAKSLLRDWERGSLVRFIQLLCAGLICGFLWEFWNYWAKTKWIYTVPFFEELKFFEMPLLGFLGFPPFTVECYVIYNFISLFRAGRTWEGTPETPFPYKKLKRRFYLTTVSIMVLFCLFMFKMLDLYTVNSYRSYIADFVTEDKKEREKLLAAGLIKTDELLSLLLDLDLKEAIAQRAGLSMNRLDYWVQKARLVELKGIGQKNYHLLYKVGVTTIEELAQQDAEDLFAKLKRAGQDDDIALKPPRKAMVRIWIKAARKIAGIST